MRRTGGGVACADDDVGCWFSGSIVLGLLVGGTMNQFKMETIDFSLPAITAYERLIHRIEKAMTLLFALVGFFAAAEAQRGVKYRRAQYLCGIALFSRGLIFFGPLLILFGMALLAIAKEQFLDQNIE